jgi:hypothetical protein
MYGVTENRTAFALLSNYVASNSVHLPICDFYENRTPIFIPEDKHDTVVCCGKYRAYGSP